MSVQPSSAEELPSKHWCQSSLPQQKSFPVSIGVSPAFLSRRASRNWSKGLEETLPDWVVNVPAIVDFFPFFSSCDVCLEVKLYYYFIKMEQSTGHVQVKNIYCICFCGAYIFVWPMSVFTSSHSYDVELVNWSAYGWLINKAGTLHHLYVLFMHTYQSVIMWFLLLIQWACSMLSANSCVLS